MTLRTLGNHVILTLGVLFMFAPIWIIVMSSTHLTGVLRTEGLQFWPGGAADANYGRLVTLRAGAQDAVTAFAMLKNSAIAGLAVGALTTLLSMMAAYALIFFRMRFTGFLFWLTLTTLLLPLEARFIPTFQVTSTLGLVNSYTGLVLPVLAVALGTFFFRQHFKSMPPEYLEAALLDGAGPLRFFRDFIVPLSARRGAAVFAVAFIIGWNQYLWPIMIATDDSLYTLVRGIALIGQTSGPGLALVVLTILPPLALLVVFQATFFDPEKT